jgi:hypothetical protein
MAGSFFRRLASAGIAGKSVLRKTGVRKLRHACRASALEAPPNLKQGPHDPGPFPAESGGVPVTRDRPFPVSCPALAAPLLRVADLGLVSCLSDSAWDGDWDAWLRAVGAKVAVRGPGFSL